MKKLESYLEEVFNQGCAAILVLLDADEQCPLEESAKLVERAAALNLNVPIAIVYAKSEYETWFICSLSEENSEGIRARLDIHEAVPDNAENIRGAKEWLNNNMPPGRAYKEKTDQAPLTHHIDLDLAHGRSRSFRRFCHAVEELVQGMDNCATRVTPMPQ